MQPRNKISNGALEGIREYLASKKFATLDDVAEIYPDLVSWVSDKQAPRPRSEWIKDAREWAYDHLQYLNGKGRRSVLTDGQTWHLASMGI